MVEAGLREVAERRDVAESILAQKGIRRRGKGMVELQRSGIVVYVS